MKNRIHLKTEQMVITFSNGLAIQNPVWVRAQAQLIPKKRTMVIKHKPFINNDCAMFFRNMSFDVRINNKYFLNWTELKAS